MRTIHKFKVGEEGDVMLPADAVVVHVGIQRGFICAWIAYDDEKPRHFKWRMQVIVTGQHYPEGYEHIGTVASEDGAVCLHAIALRCATDLGPSGGRWRNRVILPRIK